MERFLGDSVPSVTTTSASELGGSVAISFDSLALLLLDRFLFLVEPASFTSTLCFLCFDAAATVQMKSRMTLYYQQSM